LAGDFFVFWIAKFAELSAKDAELKIAKFFDGKPIFPLWRRIEGEDISIHY
jgi:hypothetical protein